MNNWQAFPLVIADQQQHIEQAEHLLHSIQPGDLPILYWSQADRDGIVLGFSQKQTLLNPVALAARTLPIYHRRAGGTAVLVGPHLLDLDVVLPADHSLVLSDIVESYRWFGEAWVTALRTLGIEARIISTDEAHAQRALRKQATAGAYERLMNRACYGSLSPYEVVVGQRKVVGFDMIRRRNGTLLQAGVVLHWESDLLASLLGQNEEEQALLQTGLLERVVGLDSLVGRVITSDEAISAFEQALFSERSLRIVAEGFECIE
jgi:lipoate-protein ligase A